MHKQADHYLNDDVQEYPSEKEKSFQLEVQEARNIQNQENPKQKRVERS